jgi:hypothetical protein
VSSKGFQRAVSAIVVLGVLALGLAACGGGGSSATTSGEPGSGTSVERPGSSPGEQSSRSSAREGAGPSGTKTGTSASESSGDSGSGTAPVTRATARTAEKAARRQAAAVHRRLAQSAGAAAPFLVETGDNSIPTYGSEASAGELAAAEAVLSGYLAARAAGDWGTACAQMSAQVQKQIAVFAGEAGAGTRCPQANAKLAERSPASARATPLSGPLAALRVESPHAFALFVGSGGQQYVMPMVSEDGAWKVNQLAPVPWPIGSAGH